jgi:ABC-type proline/glycine betaine transport system permease subunit
LPVVLIFMYSSRTTKHVPELKAQIKKITRNRFQSNSHPTLNPSLLQATLACFLDFILLFPLFFVSFFFRRDFSLFFFVSFYIAFLFICPLPFWTHSTLKHQLYLIPSIFADRITILEPIYRQRQFKFDLSTSFLLAPLQTLLSLPSSHHSFHLARGLN